MVLFDEITSYTYITFDNNFISFCLILILDLMLKYISSSIQKYK